MGVNVFVICLQVAGSRQAHEGERNGRSARHGTKLTFSVLGGRQWRISICTGDYSWGSRVSGT
ncbi:hypothetical protein Mapa_001429 [Marchantia paleacea]|nr:hypothetical protein Mapa_001429 [Marchantia paleacea]